MASKMKVRATDYVETEHGPIYNFFYSFWTHVLPLMGINVLLLIFNIPTMILAYVMSLYLLPRLSSFFELNNFIAFMEENGIAGEVTLLNEITGADAAVQLYFYVIVFCVVFLISSSLVCIGPFQAGFSQIYRNCRRQSGIYFFPDLKEGIKSNWKQSLASCLISLVVTFVSLFAIGFYLNQGTKLGSFVGAFFIAFFFVFMLIQNIVYQLMVSRELKLGQLYRNAFLFFLMNFGPCLAMIAVMIIFLIIIPFALILNTSYLTLGLFVFIYGFFMIAFIQYLLAFFTGGMIHKYMPAPKEEDAGEESMDSEETEESEVAESNDIDNDE
jgi:hypothetical protein